jgi:hypothetical protein
MIVDHMELHVEAGIKAKEGSEGTKEAKVEATETKEAHARDDSEGSLGMMPKRIKRRKVSERGLWAVGRIMLILLLNFGVIKWVYIMIYSDYIVYFWNDKLCSMVESIKIINYEIK